MFIDLIDLIDLYAADSIFFQVKTQHVVFRKCFCCYHPSYSWSEREVSNLKNWRPFVSKLWLSGVIRDCKLLRLFIPRIVVSSSGEICAHL